MFGAIIDLGPIKHICLVGTNSAPVQGTAALSLILRSRRSLRLEGWARLERLGLSWFETALKRLLTMRV
jgi:hypothetical protein